MTCQILFLSCIKGFIIHSLQDSKCTAIHMRSECTYTCTVTIKKKKYLFQLKHTKSSLGICNQRGGSNQSRPQAPFKKLGKGPGLLANFSICADSACYARITCVT